MNTLMKKILLVALGLMVLVGAAVAQPNYLQMGEREQDPAKKREYFTKAIQQTPCRAAYVGRAQALLLEGNYNLALQDLKEAQNQKVNPAFSYKPGWMEFLTTYAYYSIQQYEKAIEAANTGLRLSNEFDQLYEYRGLAYFELENYAMALKDFQRLENIPNLNAKGHINFLQSVSYYQLEQYDQALAQINKALVADPANARYRDRKGMILTQQGNIEEAEKLLLGESSDAVGAEARSGEAGRAASLTKMGQSFAYNNDYETAISYYDKALAIHKKLEKADGDYLAGPNAENYYNTYIALGDAYRFGTENHEKALEAYSNAARIKDDDYRVWASIAELQTNQRNFDYAVVAWEKTFALKPDLTWGWVNYGFCLGEQNKREEAIEVYTRALKVKGLQSRGLILNNRGFSYLEIGQLEKSRKDLEEAIAEDPSIAMSHISLGEYYHEVEAYDKAIAKFDYALSLDHRSDRETLVGYYKRGLSKLKKKDIAGAIADLERAVRVKLSKTEGLQAEAYLTLGIAYYENKEYCNAEKALLEANRIDRAVPMAEYAKDYALYLQKVYRQDNKPCD